MPPSCTIWSRGATFKPASTARARVRVNSAAGLKFMSRLSSGDGVVDLGRDVKSTTWLMLPRDIPNDVTVDETLVICKGALKGLASETVTWLILFSTPVLGRTRPSFNPLCELSNEDLLSRAAESSRLVFRAGSVTFI